MRSLNFGPDTGAVSCQFQQATGKSTMPSISKWSPVIICICLCSIAYCSSDISAHCHLQLSETRAAQQNPLQFPPWSGLVWSGLVPTPWSPGQRAIGKELQGGSEVFSHSVSQSVREIEREGSLVIFCMGGHRGWASRVFGRVLLTMIMCSYSPM